MSWKDALRGCDVVREEYILGVPPRPPFVHCEERRLMSRPKQKSLALVCAKKTYIIPPDEGKFHSKIIFDYHNSQGCVLRYKLTLTDPDFQVDSNLFLGDILLIVSLGEEYESKYFLLAAKVIQKV